MEQKIDTFLEKFERKGVFWWNIWDENGFEKKFIKKSKIMTRFLLFGEMCIVYEDD